MDRIAHIEYEVSTGAAFDDGRTQRRSTTRRTLGDVGTGMTTCTVDSISAVAYRAANVRHRAQRTVDTVGGRRNSLYPALGKVPEGSTFIFETAKFP